MNKHTFFIFIFFVIVFFPPELRAREVPFILEIELFRDAMYNDEIPSEITLKNLYTTAITAALLYSKDYDKNVQLSRCEYIRGRFFMEQINLEDSINNSSHTSSTHYLGRKDQILKDAGQCFDKGIAYAQKALDKKKGSDAYLCYAKNLSYNCLTKPAGYVMFNAFKVQEYSKKALSIDEKNGSAAYLAQTQDIFAPFPVGSLSRGMRNMKHILSNKTLVFERSDFYNIYYCLAFGNYKSKKYSKSLYYLQKALKFYPNNKESKNLLKKMRK